MTFANSTRRPSCHQLAGAQPAAMCTLRVYSLPVHAVQPRITTMNEPERGRSAPHGDNADSADTKGDGYATGLLNRGSDVVPPVQGGSPAVPARVTVAATTPSGDLEYVTPNARRRYAAAPSMPSPAAVDDGLAERFVFTPRITSNDPCELKWVAPRQESSVRGVLCLHTLHVGESNRLKPSFFKRTRFRCSGGVAFIRHLKNDAPNSVIDKGRGLSQD